MKLFVHIFLILGIIVLTAFKPLNYNYFKEADLEFISLAEVDANADTYAPLSKLYTQNEAINIKSRLEKEIRSNPNDIGAYWALLRFYSNAPNFVGGSSTMAIQTAGYIYGMNRYIGCMAYEYAFSRNKQPENAAIWYKKSLMLPLPKNMIWQDIVYNVSVQSNVKVIGNFNNWKMQHLYEQDNGNYKRRVMIPKCDGCQYKLIVDDKRLDSPTRTENFQN